MTFFEVYIPSYLVLYGGIDKNGVLLAIGHLSLFLFFFLLDCELGEIRTPVLE